MRKTIFMVRIALHFKKMKVGDLLPFAGSIKNNAGADPDVTIAPATITLLDKKIKALSKTVVIRVTNKSKYLTIKQGIQASKLMILLSEISKNVELQANAILPGNAARAILAIQRIGFTVRKMTAMTGRFFEIFKTGKGNVSIRVKGDDTFNLYHWRWSLDEITWNRIPDSTAASIIIAGLPRRTKVFFQSAQTLKVKGIPVIEANFVELQWSDSISETIQ